MTSLSLGPEYLMESFQCLRTVQIWCFQLLRDLRYVDFQTGHFADFEQFKVGIHFANFEQVQVKIDPVHFFLLTLNMSQLFYWVWAGHATKNNTKYSRTTHRIWHKSFSMIQSAGIKNWFPQSINRLLRFSLLFLSITHFSDFCDKIKYLW